MSNADLQSKNLDNADLINAILKGANLTQAILTDADLTRANWVGATLKDDQLIRAILAIVRSISLMNPWVMLICNQRI